MQKMTLSINEALKSGITEQRTFEKAQKSKSGRKAKAQDEKLNNPVTFYLNKSDYEFLNNLAQDEEETIQKFCKKIIMRFLKQIRK
ncbi:ribbon-helix-helix domain-containing protein [Campylobacter helveticus]|uniref:ribbon-helix-helix domain-containing protein n=1 Tax=Campylobacter helveticus TaxID=28898 RepID=UPI0022EAE481|nr:ribbon-helix-helix domain-containing protein [Campylobacter helveticus]